MEYRNQIRKAYCQMGKASLGLYLVRWCEFDLEMRQRCKSTCLLLIVNFSSFSCIVRCMIVSHSESSPRVKGLVLSRHHSILIALPWAHHPGNAGTESSALVLQPVAVKQFRETRISSISDGFSRTSKILLF